MSLPCSTSCITAVIAMIFAINEFLFTLLIASTPDAYTMSVALANFTGGSDGVIYNAIALVAFLEEKPREQMMGISRVIIEHNLKNAEFSVLVGDAWQGKGVGAELLKNSLRIARERGIESIWGLVLTENIQMLALAKKFFEYYGAVFAEGELSEREKALVALAVAHTIQCPYCIDAYTQACLEKGSTTGEMTEAVHVATAIRGGASLVHGIQMRPAESVW